MVVSKDMAPECREATLLAIGNLRGLGLSLDLKWMRDGASIPASGEVTVQAGLGPDMKQLATPHVYLGTDGKIERATLLIAQCTEDVVLSHLAFITDMRDRLNARDTVWGVHR